MRDAAHCFGLSIAVQKESMMDGRRGWRAVYSTAVTKDSYPQVTIHLQEQWSERRGFLNTTSTFHGPTIQVGPRSPLTAAPFLPFEGHLTGHQHLESPHITNQGNALCRIASSYVVSRNRQIE